MIICTRSDIWVKFNSNFIQYRISQNFSISAVVKLSWTNKKLRWDEGKSGCKLSTRVCQRFLNATRKHTVFVIKPEKTRTYDFFLANDLDTQSLAKKLENFSLILYRNGTFSWTGVLHLSVNCPQVHHSND